MSAAVSRWRPLILQVRDVRWPDLDPRWIESQVDVESGGNPVAVSPVGAQGLLQLMPGTARELGVTNAFDPLQCLDGGVRYLRAQYDRLPEIHSSDERLRWSWASYNGGRGFVNRALWLARADGIPEWWRWSASRHLFADPRCHVSRTGASPIWPDARQIVEYVARIESAGARLGVHLTSEAA